MLCVLRRARNTGQGHETTESYSNFGLEWRDVLVAAKDVVRVVPLFQRLQALEGFIAERGAHAVDGLVGLHVVHVAAADRPWFDGGRRGARPLDGLLVEGSV